MAQPITWQNVGLPQNMGANHLLTMAQEQYANAFQGLENIATGFRKDNIATDTANSEAQLNWFTEQARNLKPEQFTPDTMNALLANVTDPAARQAAVANFGKLGDEAFTRDKAKFDFSEARKTADFNAALRPHELDKAALGDDLIKAQMATEAAQRTSALASAGASDASAVANNLRTEGLRLELADAKDARAKLKAGKALVNKYGADIATGIAPATILDQVAKDSNMTAEQKAYVVTGINNLVNTMNTLDPVRQKEVTQELTKLDTDYTTYTGGVTAALKDAEDQLPVEKPFTQVVGQEDVNKKVKDIVTTASGGTTSTFSGGQDDLVTYINAGLDATSKNFIKSLDTALTPLIPDPEQRKAVIAEEQRAGGLQRIQSLALNTLIPTGDSKQIELSADGGEIVTEFNRVIKPYATSVANGLERRTLRTEANAKILKAAQTKNEAVERLTATTYRTGIKAKPDLAESIKANQTKQAKK